MDGVAVRAEMIAAMRARSDTAARPACLATVVVGDNPRCHAFARDKRAAAAAAGIATVAVDLPAAATQAEVDAAVAALAADGIFVQLPLPSHLRPPAIPPAKDVDADHQTTSLAVVHLLDHYDIPIDRRRAVVVGVHPDMARRLADRGAEVTTVDHPAPDFCRAADILVVATGRPRTVTADHVRPGATVVDLTGAVDNDAVAATAGALAPYPTGVGPVAVACLLRNTLDASAKLAR